MNKKTFMTDWIITALCLIGAYFIHAFSFVNWDVAWHVEGARRLLQGGSYLVNLFDNNSPYVFAYFFPVVYLRKLIGPYYPNLVTAYILFTTLFPLILSYKIIECTFLENERFTKRFLFYTIIFIIVFLPAFNLGHREMVFINFYFPYFILIIFSTTYPHKKYNPWVFHVTSLLGAYGIVQNFFYVSIPIFLDIYRYLKTKKFNYYQLLFYCYIGIEIVLIAFLYPEYFKHIIPMVLCYESGFNFPLLVLFLETLTFISILTLLIILLNFRRLYKSDDIVMTFIAALCSLLIYFFELKLWYYHLYPALSFVMFILALLITKYYEETILRLHINPRVNLWSASFAGGIMATVLAVIIGFARSDYAVSNDPRIFANRWIAYANQHFQNKKLFFFVIKLEPAYSLTLYAQNNIEVVSPWSNPWLLPSIITQKASHNFCNLKEDSKILQRITTQAVAEKKPDYLIIEPTPKSLLYEGQTFDYIAFFSEDPKFAELFQHYVPFGLFDNYRIYKLKKP